MSAPCILITRAAPGAGETAQRLAAAGYESVVSPVIILRRLEDARLPDLRDIAGLVFTSANGVRFFAQATGQRELTAWCVGPATAQAARAAGFADVRNAMGNAHDLAALIKSQAGTRRARLVHVANAAAAGHLAATLRTAGFEVDFIALYEAVPANELTRQAREAFDAGTISAVLLHSAKGAQAFAGLARAGAIDLDHVHAVGVSHNALAPVAGLGWAGLASAAQPNESALIAALRQVLTPP